MSRFSYIVCFFRFPLNLKSQCQAKSDMIIKIADTAKKIDFAHTFYIDRPLYQVTKTGLVCCNIYFF